MPRHARAGILVAAASVLALVGSAHAGVTNPNLTILGQPFVRWTDDPADPSSKRPTLDVGETELVFDDYLNPYARGFFTLAIGGEGLELEEGYFRLLRGLPAGLELKGGQYRAGFGKLNTMHPHALPFAERFRVLAAYLPGEESFNDVGLSLSGRIPAPGDIAITASADWLNGDAFRIAREPSLATNDPLFAQGPDADRDEETRPAGLARVSAFVPIHDRSGLELGVSGTRGTTNVAAGTRETVLGGDAKLKLWTSANAYLLLQGEVLSLDREIAGWDSVAAAYTSTSVQPWGGYVYADYNFNTRVNAGASYERYQRTDDDGVWDQAYGLFAGLALMEETTAFRIDWNRFVPGTGAASSDPINTITLRVIFSMGPHKAHQF